MLRSSEYRAHASFVSLTRSNGSTCCISRASSGCAPKLSRTPRIDKWPLKRCQPVLKHTLRKSTMQYRECVVTDASAIDAKCVPHTQEWRLGSGSQYVTGLCTVAYFTAVLACTHHRHFFVGCSAFAGEVQTLEDLISRCDRLMW